MTQTIADRLLRELLYCWVEGSLMHWIWLTLAFAPMLNCVDRAKLCGWNQMAFFHDGGASSVSIASLFPWFLCSPGVSNASLLWIRDWSILGFIPSVKSKELVRSNSGSIDLIRLSFAGWDYSRATEMVEDGRDESIRVWVAAGSPLWVRFNWTNPLRVFNCDGATCRICARVWLVCYNSIVVVCVNSLVAVVLTMSANFCGSTVGIRRSWCNGK